MEQSGDLEKFIVLKTLCIKIDRDPQSSTEQLKELQRLLAIFPQHLLKSTSPLILATLFHFIKPPDNKLSFEQNQMETLVETLMVLFERITTDKLGLFYNIYAFLLNEIFDPTQKNLVKSVGEEYKLKVIKCMTVLTDSLSWDILMSVYSKDNAPKLSQILYVALEMAKSERLRSLRIAAIECIMSLAKIKNQADLIDLELSNQIADIFMFFLPGLSSGLRRIALEDEKVGHKIIQVAVRAWGRIVNLLMKNYDSADQKLTVTDLQAMVKQMCTENFKENKKQINRKSDAEIKDHIKNSKRSPEWYKESDENLQHIIASMRKLSHHSHWNVRLELAETCVLLLENCSRTIPKSMGFVVEMLITLSEDENESISKKCTSALCDLSVQFSSDLLKGLLENLEENFYNTISSMPRIFNGVEEQEQLVTLNLLSGYLKLFGKYKLAEVLYSPTHVQHLLQALLHICELEKTEVCLLEEYTIQEFDFAKDLRTPWRQFRYFSSDVIKKKIEVLCVSLSQPVVVDIVCDFLIDTYLNDLERRKEATLILNEILSGNGVENYHVIKTVIYMYLDSTNWNLPTVVGYDASSTVPQIQNNIIQICLQVEGIGKMASALGGNFQEFLLRTLYAVLERAGSTQSLIKAAGIHAVSNISIACGCKTITELINANADYFSFYVMRRLRMSQYDENVLNVLSIVMRHSTMDVLPSISSIIDGVLLQSCDEHQGNNANAFLRVFNIFVKCLFHWLNIKIEIAPLKSKAQKEKELREFQLSSLPDAERDYSDDVVDGDVQKKEQSASDDEFEAQYQGYKKPDPPTHIKLTVLILRRNLNFLPSKDRERKLLALEILKNGLEIIRDWEDELLPIVHEIWSPLVDRFKEFKDPLIVNLSFQLLMVLARLSKSFICSRTVKDVLPSLLEILRKLASESFLKDKGAAYRYTQAFKLQTELLQNLAGVVCDLDVPCKEIQLVMDVALLYLNDKQPLPLQKSSLDLFKTIGIYDVKLFKDKVSEIKQISETKLEYEKNVHVLINHICLLENTGNEKYFVFTVFPYILEFGIGGLKNGA